jgi:tetratricopeptide (TPR) repeat protein
LRKRIFFIVAGLSVGLSASVWAAPIKGQISSQNDTVHVEFTGRETWDYDLKKVNQNKKTYMQLTMESVDDSVINQLKNFKSPFVKNIKVEVGPDKKSVVLFEVANESVESFDYLTDQPSRLIVDFFVSSSKATPPSTDAATKTSASGSAAKVAGKTKKTAKTDKKDQRLPANTDILIVNDKGPALAGPAGAQKTADASSEVRAGIFDGGDPNFERFSIQDYEIKEASIIKSKDNYYIPFPILELENTNWNKVKSAAPEYSIRAGNTDENKQARLLLTLFKKQRFQVYLKTLEWFREKYPNSEYNEIIAYMTADVYYKLWQVDNRPADFDMAIEHYKEALRKFPKSVLAERVSLMNGYLQMDRGDSLSAIKNLNEHIQNPNFGGPHVFSKDLARIGVYLAYLKLNKFNEAFQTLDEIEMNSPHMDLKVEAAYRKGDIFVKSKNFARAVEEYQRSLKTYPQGQTILPNAYYNQGESLFLMENFRQSMDTFREFAKRFPTDEHAPFALTRLGELLEILGADRSRVIGAYLETYFRYGDSPSAIVARLRLLSARMRNMKPKEVDTTVKEILSLSQKLDLPKIQQFATIMIADGYNQRGDYPKALDLLIKYFQENPTGVDEAQLKKRIVSNINDKMREDVEKGKFIDGLKTHQQYADNWLKSSDRLDTSYYLGRAFEQGGAQQEAEKYYQDVLNSYYASLGTQKQKNLSVLEHLPSMDSLNLRLASVTNAQGHLNKAYEYLKNIKNPEKMSDEEQIERVALAVKLLDKRGDTESAVRYLTELLKTWQGIPALLAEPYFDLAELEIKLGKKEDAKKSLEKVDGLMKDSENISPAIHAAALEKLGQLYFKDHENEKCIATFKSLLDRYEEKRPLSSIRYQLGKIYFDRGDIQKAADVWGQFKNDKTGVWQQLAQEELKGVEWTNNYKKYLKRIPAMAGKAQ